MDTQLIRQALDVGSYAETVGAGSVDAIVCPHAGCGVRVLAATFDFAGPGLYFCGECERPYFLRRVDSPLGLAWLTEAVSDAQLERAPRGIDTDGRDPDEWADVIGLVSSRR